MDSITATVLNLDPVPNASAWLETNRAAQIRLHGDCSVGRAKTNRIVLDDAKVSRNHALIHHRQGGDYTLVDLGSVNGTYLNERRITSPMVLRNGDLLRFGDTALSFRQPTTPNRDETSGGKTVADVKPITCWLLVADIKGHTNLLHHLNPDEMAMLCGRWFSECKEIVDECEGTINKYLGDGFLANWPDRGGGEQKLVDGLKRFFAAQERSEPPFRLVLHYGTVFIAGFAAVTEENLLGKDINFVFRMEKLAGSLGVSRLASAAAQNRLSGVVECQPFGAHALPGFPNSFEFFTF